MTYTASSLAWLSILWKKIPNVSFMYYKFFQIMQNKMLMSAS